MGIGLGKVFHNKLNFVTLRGTILVLNYSGRYIESFRDPSRDNRRLVQPPEGGGDPRAKLPKHHGLGFTGLRGLVV